VNILKKIDAAFNKVEGALLILLLIVMLVMAFLQVMLRNFFSGGIIWGDILLRHLVLWIGFLGAALATSGERHINIDALTRYLPFRIRELVATMTNIFAAAVCFLLFRASLTFIDFEIANKNTVYGEIPSWCAQIIIPVGFGLLAFHFLIRAILDASKSLQKGSAA
jgi:TRAP-type C4-dicarboxylate transport system permease small subunit